MTVSHVRREWMPLKGWAPPVVHAHPPMCHDKAVLRCSRALVSAHIGQAAGLPHHSLDMVVLVDDDQVAQAHSPEQQIGALQTEAVRHYKRGRVHVRR
eukprot:355754-Chlamydomonas_euryale.AAC.6